MYYRPLYVLIVLVAGLICGAQARGAVLLAGWDFNDSSTTSARGLGSIQPDADGGVFVSQAMWLPGNLLGGNGGSMDAECYGSFSNGARLEDLVGEPYALSVNRFTQNNRGFVVRTPTTGHGNLLLAYDVKRAFRGFKNTTITYSLDGVTFFAVPDGANRPNTTSYVRHELDLSSLDVLEDQAQVYFRFAVSTYDSGTTDVYTLFDNIRVIAVPEPAAAMLLPSLILLHRRRRPV